MYEPRDARATAAEIAAELEALRERASTAGLDVLAHLLYCAQLEANERSRHG